MKKTWLTKKVIIILGASIFVVAILIIGLSWWQKRAVIQDANVNIETSDLILNDNPNGSTMSETDLEGLEKETLPVVFPVGEIIGTNSGNATIPAYFEPFLANGELKYVANFDDNGWTMTFDNVTEAEIEAYKRVLLTHGMTESVTDYGLPSYVGETATIAISYIAPAEDYDHASLNITIYSGGTVDEKTKETTTANIATNSADMIAQPTNTGIFY